MMPRPKPRDLLIAKNHETGGPIKIELLALPLFARSRVALGSAGGFCAVPPPSLPHSVW